MKKKTFANLQNLILRLVSLLVLVCTFVMGNQSVVHAQDATEVVASTTKAGTSSSIDVLYGDDCGEDDERVENNSKSDSTECHPPVRVAAVWTADENLNPKTSFDAGDPIQWVITLKNTMSHAIKVVLMYIVKDPSGTVISRSERTVSAAPGVSYWEKSGVVPDAAGAYSFSGKAEYWDSTTSKTAKYEVEAACHTLMTSSDPAAGGTVAASPAPNCNNGTQYAIGTIVTLTASANTGFAFSNWSGAVTASMNPATVTMTEDQSVTANFAEFTGLTDGIYDDTDPAWNYTGAWTAATNPAYYDGTAHESMTVGGEATVMIYGSQFILYFTADSNHRSVDVYVDDVWIAAIDQSNATPEFQQAWISPVFSSTIHELRFVHADGAVVNIDAIEIHTFSDASAPAAIVDLTAATGTTAGTVDLSWTAPGDDNNTGTAASYEVRYSTSAIADEAAWDAATPVRTDIPAPSTAGSAQTMAVSGLIPGTTYFFAVRAQDEDANLGGLSNSPSALAQLPTGLPAGTYDDMDPGWTYSSGFNTISSVTGPYAGTLHFSDVVGSYAEFTLLASQITLAYSVYSNRGNLEVYIDDVLVTTINQYGTTRAWLAEWTSGDLGAGVHTVRFVHAGPSGTRIDIDALQVKNYEPPHIPAVGKYDDMDPGWTYSSGFNTISPVTGPYANTLHFSSVVGSSAEFTFEGSQITLTYSKYSNRGNLAVYIDDVLVTTINQYGATRVWLAEWTSGDLGAGVHTVRFVHSGSSGATVDVDAIEIK